MLNSRLTHLLRDFLFETKSRRLRESCDRRARERSAVPLTTSRRDLYSIFGEGSLMPYGGLHRTGGCVVRSLTSEDEKRKRGRRSPCGLAGSSEPVGRETSAVLRFGSSQE